MTVEVLGTVIGTGIQGQIVGMANAPCIPAGNDLNSTSGNFSSEVNISQHVSLEHTVSPRARSHCDVLRVDLSCVLSWLGNVSTIYPTHILFSETGLHDCLRSYLCHIRSLRHHTLLWCEGAQRWVFDNVSTTLFHLHFTCPHTDSFDMINIGSTPNPQV